MADNAPPVPLGSGIFADRVEFIAHAGDLQVWWDTLEPGDYMIYVPAQARVLWLCWDGAWFTTEYNTFAQKEATPAQLCDIAALISRHYEEHINDG